VNWQHDADEQKEHDDAQIEDQLVLVVLVYEARFLDLGSFLIVVEQHELLEDRRRQSLFALYIHA
jgi:hypothetical protein